MEFSQSATYSVDNNVSISCSSSLKINYLSDLQEHATYMFVRRQPGEPSTLIKWKLVDGHYVVLDNSNTIRRYAYDEWNKKQAALFTEFLSQEDSEEVNYIVVRRGNGGNEEFGEEDLNEKWKVEEEEFGEEIMAELNGMEEVQSEDEMDEENADELREKREAREIVRSLYEGEGEEQKYMKFVQVFEYEEEETIYEEETIREEIFNFEEDMTKYSSNGDNSQSTTESQDYDKMILKIEACIHLYGSVDELDEHAHSGTKEEKDNVEERRKIDKSKAGRFNEVMDKAGEEKIKEKMGFRQSDLQEKTEMMNVEVKERERLQRSVEKVEEISDGKMDVKTEEGEAKKDTQMETLECEETEEEVESTLEAPEVVRYDDENADEMRAKEKRLTSETIMKVLSGRYARDPSHTYQFEQYMSRDSGGHEPTGYSAAGGVESPGQAANQENGKEEANVGERGAEGTVEVGGNNEINQMAGQEKLVPTEVKNHKERARGRMEGNEGKEPGKCYLPHDNMKYKIKGEHTHRPQGNYYTDMKLDGTIRLYRHNGRRLKYPDHAAKHEENS
jgi:hypothetical protein